MQGLVRWMVGAIGVLAVVLAHAEQPWSSRHQASHAAESARWALRAPAEPFYVPGSYRLVGGEVREPSRAPLGFGSPPQQRGGSIRDAVTRYSEERGGFPEQSRQVPRGNAPPAPPPEEMRHH